jgi:hypothetical protein
MGLWFYAEMGRAMKTTVEVSDDLYRRAKAEAALRGRKLKDLVEEGLRLVLEAPRESHRCRSLAALMKGARGAVDSGVPDLAISRASVTMRAAIVDTGPLVAFLDRAEKHHRWVAERIEELDTPLLVCEPGQTDVARRCVYRADGRNL